MQQLQCRCTRLRIACFISQVEYVQLARVNLAFNASNQHIGRGEIVCSFDQVAIVSFVTYLVAFVLKRRSEAVNNVGAVVSPMPGKFVKSDCVNNNWFFTVFHGLFSWLHQHRAVFNPKGSHVLRQPCRQRLERPENKRCLDLAVSRQNVQPCD